VVATKAFAELQLKCFVDFATEVLLKLQLVATEDFFLFATEVFYGVATGMLVELQFI
jgi:hypothetical protein